MTEDDFFLRRNRSSLPRPRRPLVFDDRAVDAPPPSPEPECRHESSLAMDCQPDLVRSFQQMDIVDPHKLCESLYALRDGDLCEIQEDPARAQSSPVAMPMICRPERMSLDLQLPALDSSTESSPPIQSSPSCYRETSDFRSRSVFDCRSLPSSYSYLSSLDCTSPYRERSSSLKRMRDDSCADMEQELACSVPKRCRVMSNDFA